MAVQPTDSNVVTEGSATVELSADVFYNPVQEYNRDLSTLVIKTFQQIQQKEKEAKCEPS